MGRRAGACGNDGFGAGGAAVSIKRAVMSKGVKTAKVGPGTPTGVTTTFGRNTKMIHCFALLSGLSDTAKVRTVWTVVKAAGVPANTKAYEATIGPKKNLVSANFKLSNSNPWPVGSYKVDLYLNGKLDRTLRFNVK